VRSVRLHDLHHVLTGYDTDVLGEGEIGAFELAAGCADHLAAWYLNLNALAIALPLGPGRLLRAFARGRRSRCLYDREWDEALLEERVGALRGRLALAPPELAPTPGERRLFAATAAAGVLVFLSHFALLAALGALLL
jgi:ubiquinone biosynthesis protein Coq4